ncbi:hypothetical protein ASC89_14160 [Devosia sp. Root413D1]|uniref:hypothetical protein n=1 Tax=Devosia sp. Root413D1 TaxID=1736531 RepID=UPI0006FF930F|nr:hypothetical protein [Devosia sp. Root413D1]KQW77960.1 hypothetical protein ASC89_14160 [Devosia sp. Root413D1]
MGLVDVIHDHVVPPSCAGLLRAVDSWLADRRAARQRRMALQSLLFTPEHRLRDLGISHDVLIEAFGQHR